MAKLLVIDDDPFLLDATSRLLSENGHAVSTAPSAEDGLAAIVDHVPDLLVLDIGLPGIDGVSLCRRIRVKWTFPILMLTARSDAMDKVIGLEVGADDYLTKPFVPAELLARVRALLRRSQEYGEEKPKLELMQLDGLTLDCPGRIATVNDQQIDLTTREFDVLLYLLRNVGRVISRDQMFTELWGYDIEFSSNSLEVIIYRLRKKLGPCGELLQTVRGLGYRLVSR